MLIHLITRNNTIYVAGEIVVSMYSSDSSFYRARVVSYNLDEYDVSQSTVDLDFVDYGDCEVRSHKLTKREEAKEQIRFDFFLGLNFCTN